MIKSILRSLSILSIMATTTATATKSMNILMFGGNGFIGSHVAERLLDAGHRLSLISSRGAFNWDTDKSIRQRIDRHYRCDRYNVDRCDRDVSRLLDEATQRFDAVIDLSAYRVSAVRPIYERLIRGDRGDSAADRNRLLYVYISTDSVYEVCERRSTTDGLLREVDSHRPEDEDERSRLAAFDSYGDHKLRIEEYLIDQRTNHGGFPYAILRLPDVLGERDSTQRFWSYQLWLRYGPIVDRPVLIPKYGRTLSTSYVDAKDVAMVIELILRQRSKSADQIFNVAFPESLTAFELLTEIKTHSDAKDAIITDRIVEDSKTAASADSSSTNERQSTDETTTDRRTSTDSSSSSSSTVDPDQIVSYFPSVTRGGLDISKVQSVLGFRPSYGFKDAIRRMALFYLQAETKFESELIDTARRLMRDLRLNGDEKRRFMDAVRGSRSPEAKKQRIRDEH